VLPIPHVVAALPFSDSPQRRRSIATAASLALNSAQTFRRSPNSFCVHIDYTMTYFDGDEDGGGADDEGPEEATFD
jgi:hypothetical protein